MMEVFATEGNDWKPFTIVAKSSIVDIVGVWDPPMESDLGTEPYLRWSSFCDQFTTGIC